MCEGRSMISGPIPPDPFLFSESYKRPASARGRLEGNSRGGSLSLLTGPLAPDPSLYPGCYSAPVPRPYRIGPNATHILERDRKGEVGVILQLEGVSFFPTKHKPAARDHGKENVRRMREIQKRFREQEAEKQRTKPVPVKALWTSSKYENTPSRFMTHVHEISQQKKPECQNFLKAHSVCGSTIRPATAPEAKRNSDLTEPLSQIQVRGHKVDFVHHNARSAGKTLRRSSSLQNLHFKEPPSAIKGQVPQYLVQRKEQWRKEEEERKRNIPDPSVPAGHSRMSESERQETLQSLKENHKALVGELLSLPVKMDTLNSRSRRAELDKRLSEVEEAIKIFSRDKVYIKNNV